MRMEQPQVPNCPSLRPGPVGTGFWSVRPRSPANSRARKGKAGKLCEDRRVAEERRQHCLRCRLCTSICGRKGANQKTKRIHCWLHMAKLQRCTESRYRRSCAAVAGPLRGATACRKTTAGNSRSRRSAAKHLRLRRWHGQRSAAGRQRALTDHSVHDSIARSLSFPSSRLR